MLMGPMSLQYWWLLSELHSLRAVKHVGDLLCIPLYLSSQHRITVLFTNLFFFLLGHCISILKKSRIYHGQGLKLWLDGMQITVCLKLNKDIWNIQKNFGQLIKCDLIIFLVIPLFWCYNFRTQFMTYVLFD